jgi:hypothetical protein
MPDDVAAGQSSLVIPVSNDLMTFPMPSDMSLTEEMDLAVAQMRSVLLHYRLPLHQQPGILSTTSSHLDRLQTELEMLKTKTKSWVSRLEDELDSQKGKALLRARNEEGLRNAEERQAWVASQTQQLQDGMTRALSWLNLYASACRVVETRITLLSLQASGLRSNAVLGGA